MLPTTRQELREYCLRRLGAPVIQINLDEDQVEDRIDDAISYFQDYHFDGVEKLPLKHQITASVFVFDAPFTTNFQKNETITGLTSGATGVLLDYTDNKLSARFITSNGTFQPGEIIRGSNTTATATIQNNPEAITIGDYDHRYLSIGDHIVGVFNILPIGTGWLGARASMFDIQYQFSLNEMYSLTQTDLITYDMFRKYIALWEYEFHGIKGMRYNRKQNKVFVDADWGTYLKPDQYIIVECWRALDPNEYRSIYSDYFVREYTTALLKRQWGANLKKYNGVQLPGGATLNGQQIYDEAMSDLEKLEERIHTEFQLPLGFFCA